jgi:hypothetical protein
VEVRQWLLGLGNQHHLLLRNGAKDLDVRIYNGSVLLTGHQMCVVLLHFTVEYHHVGVPGIADSGIVK